MADIDLKTLTPDTSLPTTGFLFGADSQASTNPSVYSTQTVATTLLGSTSLTGDTLTADAPVLNLTQTWNNGAVTFTGIKYNAAGSSSTNSAAASLLMDLQVGGTSKFKVDKTGQLFGNVAYGTGITSSGFGSVDSSNPNNYNFYVRGGSYVSMSASMQLGWTSVSPFFPASDSNDTILTRKAAANLRFGAADAASPVAQTLSVQSIVGGLSGTPNLSAAAYPLTITGAQGTGTGAGGSIVFQVAPAGGSGTAQNALADALTIASNRSATFTNSVTVASDVYTGRYLVLQSNNVALTAPSNGVGQISTGASPGTGFGRLQFGGATSSFPALKRSTSTLQAVLADDTGFTNIQGKLTTDTAYTAGVLVPTGYITIYDSTGTAYRVPCLV